MFFDWNKVFFIIAIAIVLSYTLFRITCIVGFLNVVAAIAFVVFVLGTFYALLDQRK